MGAYWLPKFVGLGNARRMFLLGEDLTAAHASRLGLVDVVDESVDAAVDATIKATAPGDARGGVLHPPHSRRLLSAGAWRGGRAGQGRAIQGGELRISEQHDAERAVPNVTRSSPYTGTALPHGRPFWIVDGRAYDFTEWMKIHPGGATWFGPSQGRDISALLHTYHRDPVRLRKFLASRDRDPERVPDRDDPPAHARHPPKLGVPPFLLDPGLRRDDRSAELDYRDEGSLLAEIRRKVNAKFSKRDLRRYDRAFDVVTWAIAAAHVATLALLITSLIPAWAFVVVMVVTRTSLAGAGHYHLHRKWKDQQGRFHLPLGKALFDINYVGTSLIGTDGHVLLHHPYMGSGADVKKTFFDGMLRLHPILRIPGYTLHKLGICLDRAVHAGARARQVRASAGRQGAATGRDFWIIRALAPGRAGRVPGDRSHRGLAGAVLPDVVVQHLPRRRQPRLRGVEDRRRRLAAIPEPLRNDWAARQICLSYDLSVVGNRWIDLFLSAGLSPHRVHHVLPYQGSGFANLATEATVREVCERGRHHLGAPAEPDLRAFPGRHQALSALPGEARPAAAEPPAAPAR